jgi:AcrR family transcriptional regulator
VTRPERPHGPDAVRRALVEAAADVYAAGEPFSAREIARRAGVNHGQVHHRFGGRDGLLQATLEHLAHRQALALDGVTDPADALRTAAQTALGDPRFVRALARSLIERPADGAVPQRDFPVVARLRGALDPAQPEAIDRLAEGLATALGFALFGPWIAAALGRDTDPMPALERQIQATITPEAR